MDGELKSQKVVSPSEACPLNALVSGLESSEIRNNIKFSMQLI